MMSDALLKSVLKLSKAERILLAEQLWDSVADTSDAPPLTAAQEAELQHRLDRLEQAGPHGQSWTRVKQRLISKRKP